METYIVEDEGGNDTDFGTDYTAAKEFARRVGGVVIAYIWEFADSETVDDYRTD